MEGKVSARDACGGPVAPVARTSRFSGARGPALLAGAAGVGRDSSGGSSSWTGGSAAAPTGRGGGASDLGGSSSIQHILVSGNDPFPGRVRLPIPAFRRPGGCRRHLDQDGRVPRPGRLQCRSALPRSRRVALARRCGRGASDHGEEESRSRQCGGSRGPAGPGHASRARQEPRDRSTSTRSGSSRSPPSRRPPSDRRRRAAASPPQ